MNKNNPKHGFPVLAYPTNNAAAPMSLRMIFKHNASRAWATLCLQSSLFIGGFEEAQTLTLQYDAHNFVSGAISLQPVEIPLPQAQLENIMRGGEPQIRTLSLTLKEVCPIWGPLLPGRLTPQYDHRAPFYQLAGLAKVTELKIVFDFNWIHPTHYAIFQELINHPERLYGFPISRHYSKHNSLQDLTVFGLCSEATVDSDGRTEDEELPPTYGNISKHTRRECPIWNRRMTGTDCIQPELQRLPIRRNAPSHRTYPQVQPTRTV